MCSTDAAYYLQEVKTIDGCVLDSKNMMLLSNKLTLELNFILRHSISKIKQHILNLIKQTLQVIKK